MKIIDEYQTPDGRYEYRIKVDNEILPPMSFTEEKTEEELDKIITKMAETGVVDELLEGS